MKRLKLFILIFSLCLSVPLAYFIIKTYRGLEQEEEATLRYFAEALFDEMERALELVVQREEGRAIDEYNYKIFPSDQTGGAGGPKPSPLAKFLGEKYILGYFQNNPDGSFQTPLVERGRQIPQERIKLVAELKMANEVFNRKRVTVTDRIKSLPAEILAEKQVKQQKSGLADKYLDLARTQRSKTFLGQKDKRLEEITVNQALNIYKQEKPGKMGRAGIAKEAEDRKNSRYISGDQAVGKGTAPKKIVSRKSSLSESMEVMGPGPPADTDETADLQVEVAPLQAVFLDDAQIFIFRRIMINNQIYRQGFVLRVKAFLEYLAKRYFINQPMAEFTGLRLRVVDQSHEAESVEAGVITKNPGFVLNRGFPSPFSFLVATLTCNEIPRSAGRRTLNIMMIVLAAIVLMGLFAIYQSARTIVDLSERRSQFVSSVTHELKTPLTNIRMYIEMLEQGIAQNQESEQEYFQILDSEGVRLSRLINNVLELSKLEKKQRHIDMQPGVFDEVIEKVQTVMAEKLRQKGFTLNVEHAYNRAFNYDREVMIQVLINLIENSMKFGKSAPKREIYIRTSQEQGKVKIMVSDTGPGIPRYALKKVFNDFFRVDNSLTRTTRGTGIGLALVKKFVNLMGGTVTAVNNDGPGCSITIYLPEIE